jgi:hypothetical protein
MTNDEIVTTALGMLRNWIAQTPGRREPSLEVLVRDIITAARQDERDKTIEECALKADRLCVSQDDEFSNGRNYALGMLAAAIRALKG